MPNVSVSKPSLAKSSPGYSSRASYSIPVINAGPISANFILATFNAGALLNTRLRRLTISNPGSATAATLLNFDIIATNAATSVGTLYAPASYDPVTTRDTPYTGIARTAGAAVSPTGNPIYTFSLFVPATAPAGFQPVTFSFTDEIVKAILVPAGILNGLALRCNNGAAGAANFNAILEITEEEY